MKRFRCSCTRSKPMNACLQQSRCSRAAASDRDSLFNKDNPRSKIYNFEKEGVMYFCALGAALAW